MPKIAPIHNINSCKSQIGQRDRMVKKGLSVVCQRFLKFFFLSTQILDCFWETNFVVTEECKMFILIKYLCKDIHTTQSSAPFPCSHLPQNFYFYPLSHSTRLFVCLSFHSPYPFLSIFLFWVKIKTTL